MGGGIRTGTVLMLEAYYEGLQKVSRIVFLLEMVRTRELVIVRCFPPDLTGSSIKGDATNQVANSV